MPCERRRRRTPDDSPLAAVTALLVGTAFALGALVYVLWPLVLADGRRAIAPPVSPEPVPAEDGAVAALREIEFDHATGKLSDADYATLKARYTVDAVAALRTATRATDDDRAEAAVQRVRSQTRRCAACGPRPEPGATYCSSCGAVLV